MSQGPEIFAINYAGASLHASSGWLGCRSPHVGSEKCFCWWLFVAWSWGGRSVTPKLFRLDEWPSSTALENATSATVGWCQVAMDLALALPSVAIGSIPFLQPFSSSHGQKRFWPQDTAPTVYLFPERQTPSSVPCRCWHGQPYQSSVPH